MDWLKQYLTRSEAAFRVIDGEAIIVAARTSRMYALNPVGTVIWQQADGTMRGRRLWTGFTRTSKLTRTRSPETLMNLSGACWRGACW